MAIRDAKQAEMKAKAFHIRITEDRLKVFLDCTIPPGGIEEEVKRVRNELAEHGIANQASLDGAEQRLLAAAAENLKLTEVVILEGKPPKPPEDGYIKWEGEFLKTGFVVDEGSDKVDYRELAAQQSVSEGQVLAHVYPPLPGENGTDVTGRPIQPRRPTTERIRVGKNVREEQSHINTYFATKSGRIRFVANTLSVDDVYEISGSVGLKSGNVHHPGALIVSQNVDAESKVEADGDITVRGYIEDAEVETGGNLLVQGGIIGRKGCMIRAAGELHASFIQNADIHCDGDVHVLREISQTKIHTQGAVLAVTGQIVGGEIDAFEGIEVDRVGTTAGTRTTLIVGRDANVDARLAEKKEAIASNKAALKKISDTITPIKRKIPSLQGKARERVLLLLKKAKELEANVKQNETELEEIYAESEVRREKVIKVRSQIGPDCIFHIGPLKLHVKDLVKGKTRIAIRDGKIGMFQSRS